MSKLILYLLFAPVIAAALLYVAAALYLYVNQRQNIFLPPLEAVGPPPAESIYRARSIQTPSGGQVIVWIASSPRGPAAPCFVFFHGNASNVSDFAEFGEYLHRRGFGIVLTSYRGYAGNSGTPSEKGLMEDARAILDTVGRSGPVILWGHSLGSGVAARMASEGRANALVLESPYTSLTDLAAGQYPYMPVRWLMSDPFDTAALVPKIEIPALVLHSADDPVVPFAMGRRLAEAFGARATFVALDRLGHYPHHSDLSPIVSDWLQRIGLAF